ncbi:MAG: hypothetical protein QCI38_07190, partial [Candidatus Thermoplasmatota archaeon]|nr:hypothetical protein [Candidatus Thermoplasmatota archaeon]
MEVDIREMRQPPHPGPAKKPPYKLIGFAVMAAAILLAAVLAYFVFSKVILPIYDGGNGGNGAPTIIYYGPGYGRHLLLGQNTTSITIEVDYVVGYRPSDQMLDELRATVQMISEKPTSMAPPQEIPLTYNDYNRDILVELENQHRTTPPEDGSQA